MLVVILSCSLMTTGFSSCISDNVDNASSGSRDLDYDIKNVELIDSGFISSMDIYKDIVNDHDDLETDEDSIYYEWGNEQLEIYQNQAKARTRNEEVIEGESGETMLGMKYITIRYKTTGADGSEKDLSELIAYTKYAVDKESPKKLKNLIIGCHCTITSDKERPTNFKKLDFGTDVNMLTLIGGSETSLVVIPDYEGYGITSQAPHPYCNRDVTAQQVIDGAKAAVVWFEKNIAKMEPNWKTVAVGYSQGGAVAAGVLNYYNAKKLTGLNLIGAVCGDGPYDPLATLKQYIQDKTYTTDDIQAKLLNHSAKYGGESGFTMMAMYKDEFKPYIQENIKEGDKNWKLTNGKAMNYCTVDQCFKPGVIEYFKSGMITDDVSEEKLKALEQALKENSLTYGDWKPSGAYPHAYHFFHSTRDEVVPFCNYESVKEAWGTNLIYGNPFQSDMAYLHVGTGANFYILRATSYARDILAQKWAPGEKKIN